MEGPVSLASSLLLHRYAESFALLLESHWRRPPRHQAGQHHDRGKSWGRLDRFWPFCQLWSYWGGQEERISELEVRHVYLLRTRALSDRWVARPVRACDRHLGAWHQFLLPADGPQSVRESKVIFRPSRDNQNLRDWFQSNLERKSMLLYYAYAR